MSDRDDKMNPDDLLFTVTTTVTVYAKDHKQAAQKAFALHDTMTPEDYRVGQVGADEDDLIGTSTFEVFLEHEDKDEARRAYRAGEYFKEVKI
jgi:hypothetical protein